MLSILWRSIPGGPQRESFWKVGEKIPIVPYEGVFAIQANDDELEYIRRNFSNLPFPTHKRLVVWRGNLAKLIYENL